MDPTAAQLKKHAGKEPMCLSVKEWDEKAIVIAIPRTQVYKDWATFVT